MYHPPSQIVESDTAPDVKNVLGKPTPKRFYCYNCFRMKSKIIGKKCGECIREQCKGKVAVGFIENLKIIDYLVK